MQKRKFFTRFMLPFNLCGAVLALAGPVFAEGAGGGAGAGGGLGGPKSAAVAANPAGRQLAALAQRYYDTRARYEPLEAMSNGDNRHNDSLPMNLKPAVRAEEAAFLRGSLDQLDAVPRAQLSQADQVTYDCLRDELQARLGLKRFPDHLLPLMQMDSVPVTLAGHASGQGDQPLATPADYDAFLRRVAQLPDWADQAVLNMREGMRQGIVLPRALVLSTLPQFKPLLAPEVEAHPYFVPARPFPPGFSEADKARLRAAYRDTIGAKVLPALGRLARFMEQEYLPASRASSGWSALPDGAAWYQAWVRKETGTSMGIDAIHALGLKEVARIQAEFAALGPQLGYKGDPVGLPAWAASQPRFRPFKTEGEVLDAYRALEAKVAPHLPRLFTRQPKAKLEIRAEPEISRETQSDRYSAPSADGSRPGVFWAVVIDPTQYQTTGMTTLFLHEALPGHHFQLAGALELDIPDFRRFGANNAYAEGWALYSEALGREIGIFDGDPNALLGHLNNELLRAARLVVDTGLHAKGWTRERTIQYMRDTLGYTEAESRAEVERYMAWPGQALGYKIGSIKMWELRRRAEAALGARFDLRAFHDAVLDDGTIPLTVLEAKIERWIAARGVVGAVGGK